MHLFFKKVVVSGFESRALEASIIRIAALLLSCSGVWVGLSWLVHESFPF